MKRTMMTYDLYVDKALSKIEDILNALSIEYIIKTRYMVNIICPVHNSNDFSSSSIRLSDGKWTCWSRSCHDAVGKNFLNLIYWCLSQKQETKWHDVYTFVDNPTFKIIKRDAVNNMQQAEFNKQDYPPTITPSKYFAKRGFNENTLEHFEIGDCYHGKYAYRAIVPIKDVEQNLIGFTARSIYNQCNKCQEYHSPYQLCTQNKKWIHSYGLRTSLNLYNIHNINSYKAAIVEGPSCVWKLYEHNINAVACLGKEFNNNHKNLLKNIGVKKILFLSDNDEAGKLFKNKFITNYLNDFEIFLPVVSACKDISEMTNTEIHNNITNVWEKI